MPKRLRNALTLSDRWIFLESRDVPAMFYVSPTGSDSNDGLSLATAFLTIQKAFDAAAANGTAVHDTISIAAGTYAAGGNLNTSNVTVIGAGKTATIIAGTSSGSNGYAINFGPSANNKVTIQDLAVTGFERGIYLTSVGPVNEMTLRNLDLSNNVTSNTIADKRAAGAWLEFAFGTAVTKLTIDNVSANNNKLNVTAFDRSAGIIMWNGLFSDLTITDCTTNNNGMLGININDSVITGLTMTGNTANGNGDAGFALGGIANTGGANLIAENTAIDNLRFGLDLRNSAGNGTTSGPGSLVIRDNVFTRTSPSIYPSADLAGIAIIKRSPIVVGSTPQPTEPDGIVIEYNTVSGWTTGSPLDDNVGFGIAAEGLNLIIRNNLITNNEVGLQLQAGGTATTGNDFFDRGNATAASAIVQFNFIAGNGIGMRTVGTITDTVANPTDLSFNWWDDLSGPTNAKNPGGTGQSLVSLDASFALIDPPDGFLPLLLNSVDSEPIRPGFSPVNNPPIADDQTVSVPMDSTGNLITLTGSSGNPGVPQVLTFALATPPANGTVSINPVTGIATYTPNPGFSGTDSFTFTLTDDQAAGLPFNLTSTPGTVTINIPAPPPPPPVTPPVVPPPPTVPPVVPPPPTVPTGLSSIGSAVGNSPNLMVMNADGSIRFTQTPFESTFLGGVGSLVGDVTGDGIEDVIAFAGFTGGPRIVIYDGVDGSTVADFFAYEDTFRGGVNVTLIDLDSDGKLELLTTPGFGGGPVLAAFDGQGRTLYRILIGPSDDRGGISLANNLQSAAPGLISSSVDYVGLAEIILARPNKTVSVAVSEVIDGLQEEIDLRDRLNGLFVG